MEVALSRFEKFSSLRRIIFGGEALNFKKLAPWFENYAFDCPRSVNMYGITEACILSTYYPITADSLDQANAYIGKPRSNQKFYIYDADLNPLPPGAIGELYIGGSGLARGYLNQPQLTQERFIQNPLQTPEKHSSLQNVRLYKTGDLVRFLPDGNFVSIGRNDFQVKIRGFRNESAEIEMNLNTHSCIKQAVVLIKNYLQDDLDFTNNEPPEKSQRKKFTNLFKYS